MSRYACNCGQAFQEPQERTIHMASCLDFKISHWLELAEKATPGPWKQHGGGYLYVEVEDGKHQIVPRTFADGYFIAAARTAVPELCEEVKRLTDAMGLLFRERAAWKTTCDNLTQECTSLHKENSKLREQSERLDEAIEVLKKARANWCSKTSNWKLELDALLKKWGME